jgi:integrase
MDKPTRSFSPIRQSYIPARLEKGLATGKITQDDHDLIRAFVAERQNTKCIAVSTALNFTIFLIRWRDFLKCPYREATLTDVHEAISASLNDFKRNTRRNMITSLKVFLIWMGAQGYTSIPRDKIEEIGTPPIDRMTVQSSDLLTAEDIEKMIAACRNSRDRALIGVLAESACRIKEVGTLQWSQVSFDQYGAILNVSVKTGKPRYIRIIWAAPHLAAWRADYPGVAEGDAPVFLALTKKIGPSQSGMFAQIKKIADRAGIKTKVHPHIFRHSRVTDLLRQGVGESVIKKLAWGGDSRMISTYGHLVGEDIDAALLKAAGIDVGDKKAPRTIKPEQCPRCLVICAPGSQYCHKCGMSLTGEAAIDQGDLVTRLMADPNVLRQLADEIDRRKAAGG